MRNRWGEFITDTNLLLQKLHPFHKFISLTSYQKTGFGGRAGGLGGRGGTAVNLECVSLS